MSGPTHKIESRLAVKVTASLEKEIANELTEKDPTPEKAKAAIQAGDTDSRATASS